MMRTKFKSIRFKASVLYSLILAIILLLVSLYMYFTVRWILFFDFDSSLKIKAEEIATILNAYNQIERVSDLPNRESILQILKGLSAPMYEKMVVDELWKSQIEVLNLKDDYINIRNTKGTMLLRSNNFNDDIAALFAEEYPVTLEFNYRTLRRDGYDLRVINLPVNFGSSQLLIQVGSSLSAIDSMLSRLTQHMAFIILFFPMMTSFIGAYFARSSLRPVRDVVNLANRISHKDLSERIIIGDRDQEMMELIDAFNMMIQRLEKSFTHINEFSSHAAHELKTPLAILRGEIELALDSAKEADEYQTILCECLTEIDRMIKIVKDLLLLSKFDYRPDVFNFERMNMTAFLVEIVEQSKILAEEKNMRVTNELCDEPFYIFADKVHLRRLFLNIISNAIKYSPNDQWIRISSRRTDTFCHIDIMDSGYGIPKADLKKIFDQFYRVRNDDVFFESGAGLGLSIALSIAKAHDATISVQSELGHGSTFTVTIPLLPLNNA
jgi:two-component system heavy metal sensor histidine kinase CusS